MTTFRENGEALDEFDVEQASKDANNQITDAEFEKYWSFYAQWTRTNSDIANTIQQRHTFFEKEMLTLLDLKKRDSNRSFTYLERSQIFRRDTMSVLQNDEVTKFHGAKYIMLSGGSTDIVNAALMPKIATRKVSETLISL